MLFSSTLELPPSAMPITAMMMNNNTPIVAARKIGDLKNLAIGFFSGRTEAASWFKYA